MKLLISQTGQRVAKHNSQSTDGSHGLWNDGTGFVYKLKKKIKKRLYLGLKYFINHNSITKLNLKMSFSDIIRFYKS